MTPPSPSPSWPTFRVVVQPPRVVYPDRPAFDPPPIATYVGAADPDDAVGLARYAIATDYGYNAKSLRIRSIVPASLTELSE